MGFFKDIVDMPNQYEYSQKFYKRFYRPEYCTIVVVGDVTKEQVNALSEKYFGKWEKGNYNPEIPTEPEQKETRFAHVKNEETLPFISLNYKGVAFNDNSVDIPALYIISSIYFSQKSELYKRLVLTEKRVRSIYCGPSFNRDADLIDIDAKSNIKYSFAMRVDNPGAIANTITSFISVGGNPECVNNYYAMFDKMTADDIMNVAKKYFVETGLTIGTISGDESNPVK
jgi:zinc protease